MNNIQGLLEKKIEQRESEKNWARFLRDENRYDEFTKSLERINHLSKVINILEKNLNPA